MIGGVLSILLRTQVPRHSAALPIHVCVKNDPAAVPRMYMQALFCLSPSHLPQNNAKSVYVDTLVERLAL